VNKRYIVGAIVAVVVVVGILVGISMAGGGDDSVSTIAKVDEVKAQLAGIPQSGSTLGQASAPVEITEYGDTSCPICKDASETSIPDVIEQYVKTGKAKLTFRPVAFISPSSERGALGAEAAAKQDAMWTFVETVYANQGPETKDWLTDSLLTELVTKIGLDVDQWKKDYESEAVASAFFANDTAWKAAGGTGTPTFVIVGPRGTKKFDGAAGISQFEDAIAEVGPAS
jgi:protein-disulfide isomerase